MYTIERTICTSKYSIYLYLKVGIYATMLWWHNTYLVLLNSTKA